MIRFVFILLALMMSWSAAAAQTPVEAGVRYSLHSRLLQEQRSYAVSLPESYRPGGSRRYPTLYLLDGEAHFLHTAGVTRHLSASGDIPEMIVVAVASTVRIRDFTQSDWPEAWIGGGGAAKFMRFLADELIPHIDSQYRTDGFRVLVGHSASAQFTLHALATAPSMFHGYIALAPSLDWDRRLPARELEESLQHGPGSPTFLYFAYADDAGSALADDLNLADVLNRSAPARLRWRVRAWPDETHSSVALPGQIDGLRALYEGYRYHPDRIGRDVADADRHFDEVSQRLGWPTPVPESVIRAMGHQALESGDHSAAIGLFERNAAGNPDSGDAWEGLAEAYEAAGRSTEAARAAAKAAAIARDVDHPHQTCQVMRSTPGKGRVGGNAEHSAHGGLSPARRQ